MTREKLQRFVRNIDNLKVRWIKPKTFLITFEFHIYFISMDFKVWGKKKKKTT